MRVPPVVVTSTLMVMGLVIADYFLPQATLEVKAYRRLSDYSFEVMREEAKAFAQARGGVRLEESSRDGSERYFVLHADGQAVMLVDNSSMQLVVMVVGDAGERAPDLRDLREQWRVRTRPDWDRWR
ncbi:hypothetical protein IAE57_02385 [Stenotrophomonas sp. S48]|uniref:hypothetical protein n=1 Tax=unclassified Stenotrophomonas TaxID=196198 RepID=UPI0019002994|nr:MULTISPECIES: hypothetical protein [unclassified Stenotrophomonas]MBK0024998.1 hypothetical protein [Stenotrophomonas sp. S48]MBK0046702.1 hypothetical protein [Stenotrophomonas sp. S49]